jgi:diguanylate cyclase (GGDEF)-like protein/PAS domain S-box-containing protein
VTRGTSLRVPILVLILLAIGPLLAARFWQIGLEADRAVAVAQEEAAVHARLAAAQHQQLIARTRTFLDVLTRVPVVRETLVDQCHMLLRDLARNAPWQRRIWIVRPDGTAACASHAPRVDLNVADRDYFRQALATRSFVVSKYIKSRVEDEPIIVAAMPAVDEDGNIEAVALATLNVGASEYPLLGVDHSSDAMLMVDSGNKILSWRTTPQDDTSPGLSGTTLPEGSLAGLLSSQAEHGEAAGPDGVTRIWGAARISDPAGRIAVGVTKAQVVAHARGSAAKSIGIAAAVGVLAALAVWFGAELLLVRNIRALAHAARQIGRGNLKVRPELPASAGELQLVARALSEMASGLEEREAELHRSRLALDQKTAILEATLEHMDQGLIMIDENSSVRVCNTRAMDLLGLPPELMLSRPSFRDVLTYQVASGDFKDQPEHVKQSELAKEFEPRHHVYERERPNGTVLEIRTTPLPTGGAVRTYTDLTERKLAERRILHTARHDVLTDLPNRLLFRERLEEALAESQRSTQRFAVLWLDLDRFKAVNDALGHAIGDELLVAVADRVRTILRQGDVVARLGGDEFAILQRAGEQPIAASSLADRLISELSQPFNIQDHQLHIGASVGMAIWPSDGADGDTLLKNADLALYRAKADGRGVFRFFEAEMDAQVKTRRALELELRSALNDGEFELYHQPLVGTRDRKIKAFEALVRWNHPTRGLVSPDQFISLAEETRMILPLGNWVIQEACRHAAAWDSSVGVAVNISAVQFASGTLVQSVREALDNSGLQPHRLQLEVTESVLMESAELSGRIFKELHDLGVRIALDDFGTGYSSLSYLRSFAFDKIKIDRSFLRELTATAGSLSFIRTIVSLGASLGIPVCAEGVETEQQLELVRSLGCTEAQGYLISRPRPLGDALAMLKQAAASAA